jgi:hypothetical protein
VAVLVQGQPVQTCGGRLGKFIRVGHVARCC